MTRLPKDRLALAALLLLPAAVWAVFGQTRGFDFVLWDDHRIIVENPALAQGLNGRSLAWALTDLGYCLWQPAIWFSHLLDVSLFGFDAGAHHLTSVLWHTLAALGLFALLREASGATGRSLLVALLFAVHPLHAESVAWVTERKDVVSGAFFMLALWTYVRWSRRPGPGWRTALVAASALALAAKPIAVTLPVAMLLLDFWPLRRLGGEAWRRELAARIAEKWPIFLLAAGAALLAFVAQHSCGAVRDLGELPLPARLANAAMATVTYWRRLAWPSDLMFFYPLGTVAAWQLAAAVAAIVAAIALVWGLRRSRPALAFGLAWFFVTVAPVIGLVQIGDQALADRYAYLPAVGAFVAVAWALPWPAAQSLRGLLAAVAAAAVAALGIAAHAQTATWRNSETLFRQALAVQPDHALGHALLAETLRRQGRLDEALEVIDRGAGLAPAGRSHLDLYTTLGMIALQRKDAQGATAAFRAAVDARPDDLGAHLNLGALLLQLDDAQGAAAALREATLRDPGSYAAQHNLGVALGRIGDWRGAAEAYAAALRLRPKSAESRAGLERARAQAQAGGKAR